jgi:hypothetical protein
VFTCAALKTAGVTTTSNSVKASGRHLGLIPRKVAAALMVEKSSELLLKIAVPVQEAANTIDNRRKQQEIPVHQCPESIQ